MANRSHFLQVIAWSGLIAVLWALSVSTAPANTFPPRPLLHFYGDADGNTAVTGLDTIQVNNYVLGKPYVFDTLQPSVASQVWNTCDIDSDRLCTGLDVIQFNNYVLSKPVIIGATPWALENVDLPIAGNQVGTWIPFTINLKSTHATAGLSGRPGLSVVVEIDPASQVTGLLSGRECNPAAGTRDQLAGGGAGDQCALSTTVTDWVTATDHGDTEPGTYGLAVLANCAGDLTLNIRIEGSPGLDIPSVTLTLDVGFVSDPTLAGTYATPDRAVGVYVSGGYAYVADQSGGLQIIDVSNPASPTLAGTYNNPNIALGVYVSGNYAYVADTASGLQIIDVSNPASPTLAGTYNTPNMAIGVYVSGSYAYVADGTSGFR